MADASTTNNKLDKIKSLKGFTEDSELADFLRVSRHQLASFRSGSSKLPGSVLLRVLDELGKKVVGNALTDHIPSISNLEDK